MTRHLLITALFSLVLLPCPAQQEAPAAPQTAPVSADIASSALAEVQTIYQELRELQLLSQDRKLNYGHIRQVSKNIQGPMITLRRLAPEYRENIIMLADAILWQGQWMLAVYAGECGIAYEAPLLDEGFETIILLCGEAECILSDPEADPALRQAVQELVDEMGGADALKLPAQWLQKRWKKDYDTALNFFTGICTAAAHKSDKACLTALQKQRTTLRHFTRGGEWEVRRINALAEQFHLVLTEIGADSHPFGDPVLQEKRRTPARMKALAPFFDALPQLKTMLLKPQKDKQP